MLAVTLPFCVMAHGWWVLVGPAAAQPKHAVQYMHGDGDWERQPACTPLRLPELSRPCCCAPTCALRCCHSRWHPPALPSPGRALSRAWTAAGCMHACMGGARSLPRPLQQPPCAKLGPASGYDPGLGRRCSHLRGGVLAPGARAGELGVVTALPQAARSHSPRAPSPPGLGPA